MARRWMAEGQDRSTGKLGKRALGVGVAVALFAAVYVSLGGGGNGADASVCAAALPIAQRLDPLVGGEVAAFQVAKSPELLSSLAFTGADGGPMTLEGLEGKVVLMNLWATWCAPCRQEMPALDRLQAALGGAGFAVVPVSIDTGDAERPRAFLDSIGVKNLPLYTDPSTAIFNEVKGRGLALGLPVTILIDAKGCRLGHMNGPAEWDSEDGRRLIEAALGPAPSG